LIVRPFANPEKSSTIFISVDEGVDTLDKFIGDDVVESTLDILYIY
jgi:hypothetical protein